MAGGQGESSGDGGATGWRRFYEFWLTLPGVLTGIAAILGATAALLTAMQIIGPDPPAPPPSTTTEGTLPVPTRVPCSDRKDNDKDGKTDFPQDSGCSSAKDLTEKNSSAPLSPSSTGRSHVPCSDGKDNDEDGKTDFPQDPGCSSAQDPAETDPPCSDGKDNDEDGKTDFPQDPGCSSAEDLAEKQ